MVVIATCKENLLKHPCIELNSCAVCICTCSKTYNANEAITISQQIALQNVRSNMVTPADTVSIHPNHILTQLNKNIFTSMEYIQASNKYFQSINLDDYDDSHDHSGSIMQLMMKANQPIFHHSLRNVLSKPSNVLADGTPIQQANPIVTKGKRFYNNSLDDLNDVEWNSSAKSFNGNKDMFVSNMNTELSESVCSKLRKFAVAKLQQGSMSCSSDYSTKYNIR